MIAVREVCGVGRIPRDRSSASRWLARMGCRTSWERRKGGRTEVLCPSELPEAERRALFDRTVELATSTDDGAYDEAAHKALLAAPPSMRAAAERRAAIARFLVTDGAALPWPRKAAEAARRFGGSGTMVASLRRVLHAIDGVAPANHAPALLAGYKPAAPSADLSPEAWRFFLATLERAGPQFPITSAWRDVRDVSRTRGWAWPSQATVRRRWLALPEARRQLIRHGRAEAQRRLTQPVRRDKTTIAPLEWVSLDGRLLDLWTDWGDGRPVRPIMLALVDVASNLVLDFVLTRSENALDTVRLVKRACVQHGIFDRLYTDNGSAFASHLVAGAAPHRFRGGKRTDGAAAPGVCRHLGIELRFALPRNAQAKLAERTFATLSCTVDDRPEFAGAHAGHAPGAAPGRGVRPVPLDLLERVLRREVERHNREPGRRAQGALGRSYQATFDAGVAKRVRRQPTERQLYLAGLVYKPVSVDRHGRVTVDGWTYGGPETQDALLRHHGAGRRVLLGRDPGRFDAPALAFDLDGRLITEGIEPVVAGPYGSLDGARMAARNRKAARDALEAAELADERLSEAELRAAWGALDELAPAPPERGQESGVVAPRFGGPLSPSLCKPDEGPRDGAEVPAEFYRNMDARLARLAARGAKLA